MKLQLFFIGFISTMLQAQPQSLESNNTIDFSHLYNKTDDYIDKNYCKVSNNYLPDINRKENKTYHQNICHKNNNEIIKKLLEYSNKIYPPDSYNIKILKNLDTSFKTEQIDSEYLEIKENINLNSLNNLSFNVDLIANNVTKQDDKLINNNNLVIYPNSVKDILNVNKEENLSYNIYDLYGNLVMKGSIKNRQINISKLKSDIYMVELIDFKNNFIYRSKIIKE